MNARTNTELLCAVLGWQGGTVHQVAKATGLTVEQIIESDRKAPSDHHSSGWFAVRTCSKEFNEGVNFPKYKGNLAFWMGAARAMEVTQDGA